MNLSLQNISKCFSQKKVLQNLSIEFEEGKIHALLGDNGAGKTTTANIICGETQPDSGHILINGNKIIFKSPKDSINQKISYVHQRPMVAESLTILENLKLGLSKNQEKQIPVLMEKWISNQNPKKLVKDIGADYKFFIALTSALLRNPKVLILDEPTALLDNNQKVFLFENLRQLAKNGMNIIIITHKIDEATDYCDNIFYLKDGQLFNYEKSSTSQIENKPQFDIFSKNTIEFKNIVCKPSNQPAIKNISFFCQSGKITRIQGLSEDGLLTLENIITGFYREKLSGEIIVTAENNIQSINLKKNITTEKIRNLCGLKTGIVPTDRKFRGSNPNLKINDIINWNNQNNENYCREIISIANININENEKAQNLSGGMLQRLIIAREFYAHPDFLILCHPMQGLDPETCNHITSLIQKEAANGTAILILTSGDFEQKNSDYNYELVDGKLL